MTDSRVAPIAASRRGLLLGRHAAIAAAAALVLIGLSFVLDSYWSYKLATLLAMYCAVAGLTVLTGTTGQLSAGHGAFMAVGAYATAVIMPLLTDAGWDGFSALVACVLASAVLSFVVGWPLGIAAARMAGPYLAGLTLALVLVVPAITIVFSDVFGGDSGLSVPPVFLPAPLGDILSLEQGQVVYTTVVAGLVTIVLANLLASRTGRIWRAMRDMDVSAELAGVPVRRERARAFALSTVTAATGGALLVSVVGQATPVAFALLLSVQLLAAMVIGGLGSLVGALVGSAIVILLPDLLLFVVGDLPVSAALSNRLTGNLPLALFGIALIAILLFAPKGIVGTARGLIDKTVAKRKAARP